MLELSAIYQYHLKMGLCIEFKFEERDLTYVTVSYHAFQSRILRHFTKEEQEKWVIPMSCIFGTYEGEFLTRMWEACKQAGYVDLYDVRWRTPISMLIC